jgi:hypothetical protein
MTEHGVRNIGKMKLYIKFIAPILVFFAMLFLADIFLFRILFWKVPDRSGIEESQHYSFLHRFHNRKKSQVWLAGSSVALYGLDVNTLSERTGRSIFLFSHQGMNPAHLLSWSEKIISEKPEVIILPVNPVDFRIERYAVKGLDICDDLNESDQAMMLSDLIKLDSYENINPEGMLHEFALTAPYSDFFSIDNKASLIMGSVISFYGNRQIIKEGISQYFDYYFRSGRFYHDYQGMNTVSGGVTRQGYAVKILKTQVNDDLIEEGLTLKPVIPAASAFRNSTDTPVPGNQLMVYLPDQVTGKCIDSDGKNPGRINRQQPADAFRMVKTIDLKNSWQIVNTEFLRDYRGKEICFQFLYDEYSELYDDYLSARFSRFAGLKKDADQKNQHPQISQSLHSSDRKQTVTQCAGFDIQDSCRPEFREDVLYQGMRDDEYQNSYNRRLRNYARQGMDYLRLLEEAKMRAAKCKSFSTDMPAVTLLRVFAGKMHKAGIRLIIVNSPENPITLNLYKNSRWYGGYKEALKADSDEFLDASELLRMQEFYDSHHPTLFGSEKFTHWLAENSSLKKKRR